MLWARVAVRATPVAAAPATMTKPRRDRGKSASDMTCAPSLLFQTQDDRAGLSGLNQPGGLLGRQGTTDVAAITIRVRRCQVCEVMLPGPLVLPEPPGARLDGSDVVVDRLLVEAEADLEPILLDLQVTEAVLDDDGHLVREALRQVLWNVDSGGAGLEGDVEMVAAGEAAIALDLAKNAPDDQPSFTEITIDVRPEDVAVVSPNVRRF